MPKFLLPTLFITGFICTQSILYAGTASATSMTAATSTAATAAVATSTAQASSAGNADLGAAANQLAVFSLGSNTNDELALPTDAEINEQLSQIKDSALTDEQKAQKTAFYTNASKVIDRYVQLQSQLQSFEKRKADAPSQIKALEKELSEANAASREPLPDFSALSRQEAEKQLAALNLEQQQVQKALSEANADNISLQTLPSRAQNTIAANNDRISELSGQLAATTALTDPLDYRIMALELYVCRNENQLLQQELSVQSTLQDIANYQIRINTLKNEYLTASIRALQSKLNELAADELLLKEQNPDLNALSPELAKELKANQQIAGYIDNQLKQNAQMEQELHAVQTALNAVNQIEKTLTEQVSEINGSLMLSKLLNRQQSEIPRVSVSFNLDELIPNLNLWLYDLRSYRDELFDSEGYIAGLMAKSPQLSSHKAELENLIRHRRSLLDQLSQSMTTGLNLAINLKLQDAQLQQTTSRVNSLINDHLFWLTSNQPLGGDFVMTFVPLLNQQLSSILAHIKSPDYWSDTARTFLVLLSPLLLLALCARAGRSYLHRKDNMLALRLDKENDSYLVTPAGLLVRLGLAIPRAALITALGTLIIYFALSSFDSQLEVMKMLTLHVAIFMFFLEILKPNSLVQRHFSYPPRAIAKQRALLDRLWIAFVPVLIVANIRELDPAGISGDIIGYCLTLICCLYLTWVAVKSLQEDFTDRELSLGAWLRGLLIVLIPLTLLVMLALGYYYTVIKLVNRIAVSIYICLAYILISNTVRRTLAVAENRLLRKSRAERLQQKKAAAAAAAATARHPDGKTTTPALPAFKASADQKDQRRRKLDSLRLELINSKAFRLINIFLICATAFVLYRQWNDLAGVLNYLDTIYLWQDSSLVNGALVVSTSLSIADVLMALIFVLITVVLNRNLPALMEKLFLLRPNPRFKSTSYTVKILSSYVIIALGIIFAAGALGISWDNLQWLVAALSVGLGFGLQEIFANFVSGIIILFERQIRVGDIITLNGLSGTVNKIRIRATTIISFDNKEVMIPNREFITAALTNWSLSNTVTLLEFAIGISYDADPDKAKAILHDIVRGCRYLTPEKPYKIYIKSLDASAVTIMCEVYVNEIGNRKPTFDYLSTETLKRFAKAGIEIPFNQLDVKIKNLDNREVLKIN